MDEELPPPGTIGLSRIGGALGWCISLGQALTGDPSYWTHAFVVVDDTYVIQAMPHGAELAPLANYLAPGKAKWLFGWPALNAEQAQSLPFLADELVGVGYGYLDYLCIAALGLGVRPKWLRRHVASSDRLICSQLVDELFRRLGIHLFEDGRPSMDVTPGDIDIRWGNVLSSRVTCGNSFAA